MPTQHASLEEGRLNRRDATLGVVSMAGLVRSQRILDMEVVQSRNIILHPLDRVTYSVSALILPTFRFHTCYLSANA